MPACDHRSWIDRKRFSTRQSPCRGGTARPGGSTDGRAYVGSNPRISLTSSLEAVPDPCLDTPEYPVPVAEFRVDRFCHSNVVLLGMDLTRLQEDPAKVADALLREQHPVVGPLATDVLETSLRNRTGTPASRLHGRREAARGGRSTVEFAPELRAMGHDVLCFDRDRISRNAAMELAGRVTVVGPCAFGSDSGERSPKEGRLLGVPPTGVPTVALRLCGNPEGSYGGDRGR